MTQTLYMHTCHRVIYCTAALNVCMLLHTKKDHILHHVMYLKVNKGIVRFAVYVNFFMHRSILGT